MPGVIPWSWSSKEAYETCPKRFYETKIRKSVVEPGGAHLDWGNEVHKALELRVGTGRPLPERMQQWETMAASFANAPGDKYCELKMGITADYSLTTFFGDDVWNRGVEDLVIVNGSKAIAVDYKTGATKKRSRQLDLSAVRVMIKFPQVEVVNTAFAWLQEGKWTRAQFTRKDIPIVLDAFKEEVGNMEWSEQNNTWPAKPSGLCKRSKKPGSTYMGCPVDSCPHSEAYRRPK